MTILVRNEGTLRPAYSRPAVPAGNTGSVSSSVNCSSTIAPTAIAAMVAKKQ